MEDSADDTPTKEIPVVTSLHNQAFTPLDSTELSSESILRIREQITAARAIEAERRQRELVDKARKVLENRPPPPYRDRFSIWRLIFDGFLPSTVLLVAVVGCSRVITEYSALGESFRATLLIMAIIAAGAAWYDLRVYTIWSTTYLFSNPQETGISRPGNLWLLIDPDNDSLKTSSIQTKKAAINIILLNLGVNAWKVTLLPASEEGKNDKDTNESEDKENNFLRNRRFVRSGDKLLEAVNANQQYKDRS